MTSGSVTIRPADPVADFVTVVRGAGAFAGLVNRPDIFPEPGTPEMEGVVRKLMAVPGFTVLLAEEDGRLVGGIGFWIGDFLMHVGKTECQELFWWCAADAPASAGMRLLRAAKRFGQEKGATVFVFHRLMTSPPGVDSAYRHLGAEPIQITHMGAA